MHYDPTHPVAVFLGPSLPRADAERVLPANYYPPVRRGDIYRLLGTGVRVIVIIDGVFHFTTPVWPREIAAALSLGIVVIGASSMGALRAAELHQLGMIGVGGVFDAFRSGTIDGDDEVALMHADGEHGFRAQSEALVNVRHNVTRAVARGLIDRQSAEAALAALKSSFFGDRSYETLLRSDAIRALGDDAVSQLRAFFSSDSEDRKALDAVAALEEGGRHVARSMSAPSRPAGDDAIPQARRDSALLELLDRGVWRTDGRLIPVRAVVQQAMTSGKVDPVQLREAVARFYLGRWIDAILRPLPQAAAVAARAADSDADPDLLRRVGLTAGEHGHLRRRRALQDWVLDQPPERFGLDFSVHQRCLHPMLARAWSAEPQTVDDDWFGVVLRQARMAALVTRWAREQGIVCPGDEIDAFVRRWEAAEGVVDRRALVGVLGLTEDEYRVLWGERASYHWLLDKGPGFFGFDSFSHDEAIVREWQITGAIAAMAESVAQ